MNSETSSLLRNSITFSKIPRLTNLTVTPNKVPVMKIHDSEQASNHDSLVESHRELEGKFDCLKGKIDGLKSLLERLVQQND